MCLLILLKRVFFIRQRKRSFVRHFFLFLFVVADSLFKYDGECAVVRDKMPEKLLYTFFHNNICIHRLLNGCSGIQIKFEKKCRDSLFQVTSHTLRFFHSIAFSLPFSLTIAFNCRLLCISYTMLMLMPDA